MRNLYSQFSRDAYEANRRYPHPAYPHWAHRMSAWHDILYRARTLPSRRYGLMHLPIPMDMRRRISEYL